MHIEKDHVNGILILYGNILEDAVTVPCAEFIDGLKARCYDFFKLKDLTGHERGIYKSVYTKQVRFGRDREGYRLVIQGCNHNYFGASSFQHEITMTDKEVDDLIERLS